MNSDPEPTERQTHPAERVERSLTDQYLNPRVNDLRGPDQTPGTADDDDGDPPQKDKAQREAAVTALITEQGPILIAGFGDWSLRNSGGTSPEYTIGFALSSDFGGTWATTGMST